MALIDVNELLSDPDLSDTFQVMRSTLTVTQGGVSSVSSATYDAYGVVQPASGRELQLLPDSARTAGTIIVYTPFALQGVTDTTVPDIVIWDERNYRVTLTNPYTNYGAGYTQATCTLIELADETPDDPE
jgi:hypothetical protein